jgi:hypothetical protein
MEEKVIPETSEQQKQHQEDEEIEVIPIPESLNTSLKIVERIMNQNEYLKEHIEYKNYPVSDVLKPNPKKEEKDPEGNNGQVLGEIQSALQQAMIAARLQL